MTTSTATGLAAVREALAAKPDGVLESLAQTNGVGYRDVLDCLASEQKWSAPGSAFEAIWGELVAWGQVMFIVHTVNGVFETKAPLPPGSPGRGYFNIHGESPIGGHLKADRCAAIYFVDRPFFGRRSCSIQFIDVDGDAMFKVFVARDANREMLPEQVSGFETLRSKYAHA